MAHHIRSSVPSIHIPNPPHHHTNDTARGIVGLLMLLVAALYFGMTLSGNTPDAGVNPTAAATDFVQPGCGTHCPPTGTDDATATDTSATASSTPAATTAGSKATKASKAKAAKAPKAAKAKKAKAPKKAKASKAKKTTTTAKAKTAATTTVLLPTAQDVTAPSLDTLPAG